jgi:hypothetical protein
MAGVVVLPLVGITEVGKEGARLHEALGTLQFLDDRTPQRGQTDQLLLLLLLLLVQVKDEAPIVTMVWLIREAFFSF